MSISEQIENLRRIAKEWNPDTPINPVSVTLNQAADTIESLFEKMQAANTERNGNKILKEIREKAQELSNQLWGEDERHLIGKGIQCMCVQAENIIKANMERSAEDCVGWIPRKERLPETRNNILICQVDGYVSVGYYAPDRVFLDLNSVPFNSVVAWRELPEPYHEP